MTDEDFLSDLSDIDLLKVRASESKTHSELCAVQSFCLNGGTCYRLKSLAMHYCEYVRQINSRCCLDQSYNHLFDSGLGALRERSFGLA